MKGRFVRFPRQSRPHLDHEREEGLRLWTELRQPTLPLRARCDGCDGCGAWRTRGGVSRAS